MPEKPTDEVEDLLAAEQAKEDQEEYPGEHPTASQPSEQDAESADENFVQAQQASDY